MDPSYSNKSKKIVLIALLVEPQDRKSGPARGGSVAITKIPMIYRSAMPNIVSVSLSGMTRHPAEGSCQRSHIDHIVDAYIVVLPVCLLLIINMYCIRCCILPVV